MQYAHQACIQRWIDEKGNRTCEICHGPFSAYFADPPPPPPRGTAPLAAMLLAMPHNRRGPYDQSVRPLLAQAPLSHTTIVRVL